MIGEFFKMFGGLIAGWAGKKYYMGSMAKEFVKMGLMNEKRLLKEGATTMFKRKYGAGLLGAAMGKRGLAGSGSAALKAAAAKYPGSAQALSSMARNMSLFNNAERFYWGALNIGIGAELASGLIPGMAQKMPDVDIELMNANQYILPRAAYTQRARALQAIHQSQLSTRSALGQEASYAHM